jgi:hypothetical protein
MMRRFPALFIVLFGLVFGAYGQRIPHEPSASAATAATSGTGQFTLNANGTITDPQGNPWISNGMNILDNNLPSIAALQSMFPDVNQIRLAAGGDRDGWTTAQPNSTIEAFCDAAAAAHIVCVIESHYTGQPPAASLDATGEYNWYHALATYYAVTHPTPYVWFESGNELGLPGLTAEHQNVYDAVRSAGYQGPIILTTADGNPFSKGGTPDGPTSKYYAMTQVIWGQHWYNWIENGSTTQSVWDAAVMNTVRDGASYATSATGTIPTIFEETGYNDYVCSSNGPTGGVCGAIQAVTSAGTTGKTTIHSAGFSVWNWEFTCCAAQTDQVSGTDPHYTLTRLGEHTAPLIAGGPAPDLKARHDRSR